MATPTPVGGLNQVSTTARTPAGPAQAGKVDAGVVQAENLETLNEASAVSTKDKAVDDLSETRSAMDGVLKRLRAELDNRKNRMFDPVLMQAAAGFLKPTKSGSFGESLGYAAEGAGIASERDQVRQAENIKLESELAEKEMAFRQQLMGDRFLQRFGPQTSAPVSTSNAAAQVATAPVLGEGTPVAQLSASQRILQNQPQERLATEDDLREAQKTGNKNIITFVENKLKRQQLDRELSLKAEANQQAAKSERVKFTPQGAPETFVVEAPRSVYDAYMLALEKLDANRTPEGRQEYFNFLKKNNLLMQSQLPKESSEPIKNAPSAIQTEIQKAGGIKRTEEAIKADEALRAEIKQSEKTSQERVIAADQIYGLAYGKDTGRIFELFTKPTVRNVIATAIQGQGGVRTPLGSFEIANIKKAMQLAGAKPRELDAAQTLLRSTTMLNLQDTISSMSKQGAITEGERALISQLNPNVFEDTRNSAMAKAQLVKARAEYDKDISDALFKWKDKNPDGFVDDFKQSKEFKSRYDDYNKYTSDLAKKYFPNIIPAPSTRRRAGPLEAQIR
jgi:hypothetical protein